MGREKGEQGSPSISDRGPGRADRERAVLRQAQDDREARERCPFCGSVVDGERVRIRPTRAGVMQVGRVGKRLLFDDARKKTFLQWFALTANIGFAAEQAGVCRQTVCKHRLADPDFAARYSEALSLAVPDLQARLLAYLQGRPVLDVVGELEPPDDAAFDPQLALQILRELSKMQANAKAGGPLKPGRPRVASNEEVAAALVKRLAAYGVRISSGVDTPAGEKGGDTPAED